MGSAIRVGIVDDSNEARQILADHLARYGKENSVTFVTTEFSDGYELVEKYRPDYDILFLDVQMPGLDGFKAAEAIRLADSKVIIIFVTNMSQYATRGYSVDALSYLLKPTPYFAFQAEMARCIKQLSRNRRESLVVGAGSALRRVDLADIIYIESIKHKIIVHTIDGNISYSGTLKACVDTLADKDFYQSNSCYLVNLHHVKRIDGENAQMSNNDVLKTSRPRKKGFMEALTNYLGGRLV